MTRDLPFSLPSSTLHKPNILLRSLRIARTYRPTLNLAKQTDLNSFFGLPPSSPLASPSRSNNSMAAAKRKSATPDSKPPTKRARKSTSPAKVKEEDPDSDGRGEELRKPIKEDREQETSILPDLMSETPLAKLYQAMKELSEVKVKDSKPSKDGIVVYWMR